jgi:flagellar protein FlaG
MNIDSINAATAVKPRASEPPEEVERKRQEAKDQPDKATSAEKKDSLQPEELLSQIKALTEEGLYSVRFEQNKETNDLVVKVVDSETDEVVRQIPPEELMKLSKRLKELKGNLVDTVS